MIDMAAKGLEEIRENYSNARCSYMAEKTGVNFGPPKTWGKPAPAGDKYLQDYYNTLQYTLYETGHPETIDRTSEPRKHQNKECVNIAILSSPIECIGILLEGGKQLPGGFHLVVSPSWLSKVPSDDNASLSTLFLHKSITFHPNGASFIDEFVPPLRVTYFVNYFTDDVTSGQRNDGIAMEKNIDCPMSSSVKLCELVEDKVWTRDIMADVRMEIPETLAFRRMPVRELSSAKAKMKTVDFDVYSTLAMTTIETEIAQFSEKLQLSQVQKIVVKHSGARCNGKGISLHNTSDISSIAHLTNELLRDIDEGCCVLIEEFVEHLLPLDADEKQALPWSADETLGFCVRSIICRDHDDMPVTTLINCAIAAKTSPIDSDNSVCHSLDSTLLAYNVFDKSARQQLEQDIRIQSADVLKLIIEREKMLSIEERGGLSAQTDVIGIDMVVTKKAGKLIPVGIGVKSHECTINSQRFDFMMSMRENMLVQMKVENSMFPTYSTNILTHSIDAPSHLPDKDELGDIAPPLSATNSVNNKENFERCKDTVQQSRYCCGDSVGRSVRPLVRNMISRSQRYVMKGKQLLVIGGGGVLIRNYWSDSAAYGIKIILVDSDPNHPAREQVHRFLTYDIGDHQKDSEHARGIFNLIHTHGIHVDGCLTFLEDLVPLVALLNEMMGTKGSSYKACLTGKKKSRTQNVLNTCTSDIPHWPRTYLYSSKSVHIKSEDDIMLVPKTMQFPMFLKLEHGSNAVGAGMVRNETELKNRYKEISESLRTESDFPGIGLGYDNTMVAMEFISGYEHNVDVIIYDRKLICAFITDNGPPRRPNFTETSVAIPSSLPADKQAQLIVAAYQCCTEIGLVDGIFCVELATTKTGPKLIEINARMGALYVRKWVRKVYGIDLMLFSLMIASGVQPYIPKHPPNTHLVGLNIVPSLHSHVFKENHFRNKMKELVEISVPLNEDSEMPTGEFEAGEYEKPIANIAVCANTTQEAKYKLLNICRDLKIDQDGYQVEEFLKYF